MEKISKNVYVETGFRGSNDGFVVTSEGLVTIDTPQFAIDGVKWRDTIAKYGEVKYVIYTEPHNDHVSGAFYLKGTVVGHEGIRQTLLTSDAEQMRQSRKGTEDYDLMEGWHYRPPTITFTRDMTLHLGKHTFKLINLPGHTPFQTAVVIPEERVAFTSDNLVYKTDPFLRQALPFDWLEAIKQLAKLDADILVPGHGDVCNKSALPEMAEMVQKWMDTVKNAVDKGMTLEEVQKNIPALDRYEKDPARIKLMRQVNITRLYEVFKK